MKQGRDLRRAGRTGRTGTPPEAHRDSGPVSRSIPPPLWQPRAHHLPPSHGECQCTMLCIKIRRQSEAGLIFCPGPPGCLRDCTRAGAAGPLVVPGRPGYSRPAYSDSDH
jgi:hypothetical protein